MRSRASVRAKSAERTLREQIPAPPDEVRRFYADLNNIRQVHPLVVSVRTVARHETADGYETVYRVRDRIPLRPFSLRITYWARIHVPTSGALTTEARQFPRVRLHGRVAFEPCDGGTRIVERIRIQAPRLLASLTQRQAVKAHREMLAGIRAHFAQR